MYPALHTQAVNVEVESTAQFVHSKALLLLLYLPDAHTVHPVAPRTTASVPTPQVTQDAFPAVLLYFPVVQSVHIVAPVTAESEPTAQTVHGVFACKVLYVPIEHLVHVPALSAPKPAVQVQLVRAMLDCGAFEFAGHGVHELAPVAAPYVSGAQFVHTVPEVINRNFPGTHNVQTLTPACEYLPLAQAVHDALAGISVYVPAPHAMHGPPFNP